MSEEKNHMRAITFAASLFMAGSAFAGSDVITYTPSKSSGNIATQTYINARVIRVSPRAQTITFRSDNRDVVLAVEGEALTGLGRLRAGDDVLLSYRMGTLAGRSVRIVNAINPGDSQRFVSNSRGTVTTFPVVTPAPVVVTPASSPNVALAPSTLDESARIVTVPSTAQAMAGEPVVVDDAATVNGAVLRNDTSNFTYGPASPVNREIPQLPGPVATGNVVPPSGVTTTGVPALDYENSVRVLAAKANQIDGSWTRYRDLCLSTAASTSSTAANLEASGRDRGWFAVLDNTLPAPTEDQCRQLLSEMTKVAMDWRDQMTSAEAAARSYDVLPGQMRETRQRYRVDF
jgi:hypothetical protein